jgi:excisionase family DNA binding protein
MQNIKPQITTSIFTYNELAEYLKVQPGTLRKWVMDKKIPFIKIGGKSVRFKKTDIDNWLEYQRIDGDSI